MRPAVEGTVEHLPGPVVRGDGRVQLIQLHGNRRTVGRFKFHAGLKDSQALISYVFGEFTAPGSGTADMAV